MNHRYIQRGGANQPGTGGRTSQRTSRQRGEKAIIP